jgi:malonyl CoA-acyl carrier protein transacylase
MLTRSAKPNRCKHCRERMPAEFARHVLHEDCIAPWLDVQSKKKERARLKKEREARKVEKAVDKARKEKLKSPTEWEQECREIVQKIARLRDRHDGCISCHMGPNYDGQWHGSHFRPAGNNSAVQFHLWNIHKACAQCNLFKGGNIAAYRPRLVEKITAERVEWLESQTQVVKRNVPYLIRFKAVMGKRLRRIEKRIKGEFA